MSCVVACVSGSAGDEWRISGIVVVVAAVVVEGRSGRRGKKRKGLVKAGVAVLR